MNFTVDDTYPALNYSSSPGWHTAPATDPNLGQTFGRTYHATQENQASFALSFTGSAIYIFGSKGPGHSNFSVRWNNLVQPGTANSPTVQYRQLLWSRVFPTDGSEGGGPGGSGQHQLLFTNVPDGTNNWLDIDFLTFSQPTNGTTTADPGPYSTTNAAFLSGLATSTIAAASSTADAAGSSPTSTSSSHSFPMTIITVVLGVLLGLLILAIVIYFLRRKFKRGGPPALAISPYQKEFPKTVLQPPPTRQHGNFRPIVDTQSYPSIPERIDSASRASASPHPASHHTTSQHISHPGSPFTSSASADRSTPDPFVPPLHEISRGQHMMKVIHEHEQEFPVASPTTQASSELLTPHAQQYPPTSTLYPPDRETHNGSAMGWSERTLYSRTSVAEKHPPSFRTIDENAMPLPRQKQLLQQQYQQRFSNVISHHQMPQPVAPHPIRPPRPPSDDVNDLGDVRAVYTDSQSMRTNYLDLSA